MDRQAGTAPGPHFPRLSFPAESACPRRNRCYFSSAAVFFPAFSIRRFLLPAALACATLALADCGKTPSNRSQGYVEGEFIHLAAPLSGRLTRLHVERGSQVAAGDPLFELESDPERPLRNEARERELQARAELENARKGARPSEIEALEAELAGARAALAFSTGELARLTSARRSNAVAERDLESARALKDSDHEQVRKLEAALATAKLGAREDLVQAAEHQLAAQQAALAAAEWALAQKNQAAPAAGQITDLLFRVGDFIPAGTPVLTLLPPENLKIRAFAPQGLLAILHVGDQALVHIDGLADPVPMTIEFISPRAEFTPPVIYSQQMRGKFCYRVDLRPPSDIAASLHPGQPVDVVFLPPNP